MIYFFKQINQLINILLLCLVIMIAGCKACNENGDLLEPGTKLGKSMLSTCPPDYHESMQEQAHMLPDRRKPIIIKGKGSSNMSLVNRTGRAIDMSDISVEVQADNSVTNVHPLLKLTLGNLSQVNNGTKCSLSSICGKELLQPNESLRFSIQDIQVNPAFLSLPLHFHLIHQGNGIRTIDQEVIWNP